MRAGALSIRWVAAGCAWACLAASAWGQPAAPPMPPATQPVPPPTQPASTATHLVPPGLEFYGPERQPDRIIDLPVPGSAVTDRMGAGAAPLVLADQPRLLWPCYVARSNVWAMLVWFWPEAALLLLLVLLLVSVRRLVRVWRTPAGEGEFCRRCHYSLQGAPGDTCPECGADVRGRNRVPGHGRRRRWVPALASGLWATAPLHRHRPPYQATCHPNLSRTPAIDGHAMYPRGIHQKRCHGLKSIKGTRPTPTAHQIADQPLGVLSPQLPKPVRRRASYQTAAPAPAQLMPQNDHPSQVMDHLLCSLGTRTNGPGFDGA